MKTVQDIRTEFLGFFKGQGHEVVPSSSLVPHNDPSLMFVNSGMVQFKDVFTGKEKRSNARAASAQKCVRAGGKHNDLENVGYTARHHTFFEMLGNFSFGDYFKEEAIEFAWTLLTKNFGIDQEKLCITVYHDDDDAFKIWKKITGFSDDKIIRIETDDNFWRMGDTGPCGPCTEIFYDHGEHIWGGPPGSAEEDGDRFIEIWNIVFTQFEQIDADTLITLPQQNVDTGMGLERVAATLMGSNNNYDIDIMRSLIEHSADLTSHDKDSPSHKVIADHLRSAAFLLADGVMPSNEGRGYVLRRIMRRGMRHAHLMGTQDPLMYKLFPTLLSKMGEAYPELEHAKSLITQTLETEEKRFKTTLDRGLKILDEETAKLGKDEALSGAVAFKLYDTFGFPLDLTQDALRAQNIAVDTEGFETCMNEQKAKARAAWSGSGDVGTDKLWFDILDEVGPTEFLGYDKEKAEGTILTIVKDGQRVEELKSGEEGIIITNQTPFYAESGGQVGDTGRVEATNLQNRDTYCDIVDTHKKLGKLWVHHVGYIHSKISVNDTIDMIVDQTRRTAIQSNHSATHLLHEALRRVLGDHVSQKGSLQDENRTRFDISQPTAITPEQLSEVETLVNKEVRANTKIETRVMALDEARESGAMALFGEKYADEVRVVSMGTQNNGENKAFSVELCGGTHAANTGDIGRFKITSEGALSSGIRRLEAVTGPRVEAYKAKKAQALQDELNRLTTENAKLRNDLTTLGGEPSNETPTDQAALIKDNKRLQKDISEQRRQQGTASSQGTTKDINGTAFLGKILEGFPPKDLKPMVDELKQKIGSGVVALVATNEGKASIVIGVTADLTDKISAVDLVRVGSEALGGKGGGGRPDMAQAGGPNAEAANDSITAIEQALAQ